MMGKSKDTKAILLEIVWKIGIRKIANKFYWYVSAYDWEDKNSGGSSWTNHLVNNVLSVLSCHVETVVLLSKLNTRQYIKVEVKMNERDLTATESKAIYDEIKAYVLEKAIVESLEHFNMI